MSLERWKELGGQVDELDIKDESSTEYHTDGQYTMMNRWVFDHLKYEGLYTHWDVGGQVSFLAILSSTRPVNTIDIRDPGVKMRGLQFTRGDITDLPLIDNNCYSLSCLHVAEHIGLGRYGDEIDPDGFNKACKELSRVLAPGGRLYFAVPQGKPRVVFNAHRILSSRQVLDAFPDLELIEYSGMDSTGRYAENVPPYSLDNDTYGCGMFLFTKSSK